MRAMTTLWFGAALLLGACATPYQKGGMTGGWSETRISDSSYFVAFAGNGYASRERVMVFWLYRCAELTLEKGYSYLYITPGEMKKAALPADGTLQPASLAPAKLPTLRPAILLPEDRPQAQDAYYVYSQVSTWNSRGTVQMYRPPLPQDVLWALDARRMLAMLAPYKDAGGDKALPDLGALFASAVVGHARVALGSDTMRVEAITDSGKAAPTAPARTAPAIRSGAYKAQIGFHKLFQLYSQQYPGNPGGTVILDVSISSNGYIDNGRVVSANFLDPQFPEAVLKMLREVDFGAVPGRVRVPGFAISLTPDTR